VTSIERNHNMGKDTFMHNLHFILLEADSAKDAAFEAEHLILDWGNDNNWRSIGGVASEDGSDDIENLEDKGWSLSFLNDVAGIPREGTYFSRALAFLHRQIKDPVTLPWGPCPTHPDLRSALRELSDTLSAFDPDRGNSDELWAIGRNLKHLSELIDSRRARDQGEKIPQFYDWQFDQFGLTDMTEMSDGARRYLVFLDMHS
jgi:hypothetical protein